MALGPREHRCRGEHERVVRVAELSMLQRPMQSCGRVGHRTCGTERVCEARALPLLASRRKWPSGSRLRWAPPRRTCPWVRRRTDGHSTCRGATVRPTAHREPQPCGKRIRRPRLLLARAGANRHHHLRGEQWWTDSSEPRDRIEVRREQLQQHDGSQRHTQERAHHPRPRSTSISPSTCDAEAR